MAGVFAALTAAWSYLLLAPANAGKVYRIHWLMALLVACKALTLMSQVCG
jgi:hypothetical protein